MSLCPHGYTAFWDCPECEYPVGLRNAPQPVQLQERHHVAAAALPGLTLIECPPNKHCDHVFDGPEVPVSGDPERPGGWTTTCSKCSARAIDVHLWTLP